MPSRHNTPCHRHDNRAVANTTRYPEGGTSRALTGPEGTRRLTEGAGRAGAKEKTTAKTKGQQKPATPQAKTKQKTKGPREQAEASKPHIAGPNTPPREKQQTRNKPRRQEAKQSNVRQETRQNATTNTNELKSTSAPAQSAQVQEGSRSIYGAGGPKQK